MLRFPVDGAWSADDEVERDRQQRNGRTDGEREAATRALRRPLGGRGEILEQARLELLSCALMVLARELACGEIGVELAQLVAVNRDIHFGGSATLARAA